MPQSAATYPNSAPSLTVGALLKQPRFIARNLADLTYQRFIADRIFTPGTPEQIAGGVAEYQLSESIFPDRDVEEVGVRAEFPRTTWTEAVQTALVKQYGLEVPISDLAVRRNQIDKVARGQRKLANAMVRFVDTKAMNVLTTDANVQTMAASGDWTTAATDIISDIATAKSMITAINEGYVGDTLVVNPAQELDLIKDKDIRDALPRENNSLSAVISGQPVPILGLRQILVTPQLTAGTVILMNGGIAGTIADEIPEAEEGYVSYATGPDTPRVWVKVYREEKYSDRIIRVGRWPAMWLSEPKSVVKITGA